MRFNATSRSTRWAVVALGALACAFALPMQGGFDNERSHYALVRALANGTPIIDRTRYETGDQVSVDVTFWNGHTYSNKAPGLAFLSVPAYTAARAIGVSSSGDPSRMLWALSLLGVVLPAVLLLMLVQRVSERLAPGSGVLVAVVLGTATLTLPFATLFYSHVLAATLVFAAFAALFLLRERRPIAGAALAGVVAGYAVTTEYATLLAAVVLCGYAAVSRPWALRVAAYIGGFTVGVAPLLTYNRWAFGSLLHFSWAGTTTRGRELPSTYIFTFAKPRLEPLLESLFGISGLVTTTPVAAAAVVGIALLARTGARAEAVTIAAIAGSFLLFNASFGSGFDAYSGGERYLIATLPLLAVPLGCALMRWPATTVALSLVSALMMVVLASSHVRVGEADWLDGLAEHRFPQTMLAFLGVTGWYAMLVFFVLVAVAFAVALAGLRAEVRSREVAFAGAAVLAWAVLAAAAPRPDQVGGDAGSLRAFLPAVLVLAALVGVVALGRRNGWTSNSDSVMPPSDRALTARQGATTREP